MNHGRSFGAVLGRRRKLDAAVEEQSVPRSAAEVELWRRLMDPERTSIRDFLEAKDLEGRAIFTIATKEVQEDGTNLVPLVLWPNQRRLLEIIEECWAEGHAAKLYVPKDREQGTSFAVQVIFAVMYLRGGGGEMRTISHVDAATKGLCDDFDSILRAVPKWVYRELLGAEWVSKREGRWKLRMRGGVRCVAQTMTCRDGAMGRGFRLRWVHLSEMPWWARGQKAVKGALTTLRDTPGNIYVFESTGRGYDDFYRGAKAAKDGESDWRCYFLSALTHPAKRTPFRSKAEREKFIESIGQIEAYDAREELKWQREGATPEQLNWRRIQIAGVCQFDTEFFKQEHPVCLRGDTLISTDRGLIPIRDAAIATRTESGPIERVMRREPEQLVQIKTSAGRTLCGTADHPVKTPSGFVPLGDLRAGMTVELRPPMFSETPYVVRWSPVPGAETRMDVTEEIGEFLGMFMGDGSWYKTGFQVACDAKDEDVVAHFAALCERVAGIAPKLRTVAMVKGRKGVTNIVSGGKDFMPFMQRMGAIRRNCNGQGAWKRNVCIPEAIWRSPKNVVRAFLRGLFETDGSSGGTSPRVSFASVKREMADGVQLLLLGFGITSVIARSEKPRPGHPEWSPRVHYAVNLRAEESRVFMREIGFIGSRKSRPAWMEPSDEKRGRACLAITMTDAVASTEVVSEEETYDLTVGETHVFSANGILTHNCFEDAFRIDSDSVFDAAVIDSRRPQAEREWSSWVRGNLEVDGTSGDVGLTWTPHRQGLWWVKKEPERGRSYCFGADPSSGKKVVDQGRREADFATIDVRDIESGEVVALYRGHTPPENFAVHVLATAKWYGWAKGYVEANNDGKVVLYAIPVLEEAWGSPDSILLTQRKIVPTTSGRVWEFHPGFWVDAENKPVLVNRLRRWVREMGMWMEGEPAVIPLPLLDEMRLYIAVQAIDQRTGNSTGRIKYEAQSGHDDRVSAAYLCMEGLEWLRENPEHQTKCEKVTKKRSEEVDLMLAEFMSERRGRGGAAPILGKRFSGR